MESYGESKRFTPGSGQWMEVEHYRETSGKRFIQLTCGPP